MNKKKILLPALVGAGVGVAAYKMRKKVSHTKEDINSGDFPLRPGVPENDPETDWGHKKTFNINKDRPAKVLITGAGSYIGESFEHYCESHYSNISITTLDMKDEHWAENSVWTQQWDTVFHVAGIAHADVGKPTETEIEKYYKVNTDLTINCARKAKVAGGRQFIFMSSMIIYGRAERVDENTLPGAINFYGDSKWQADRGVRTLVSSSEENKDDMKVAVLRPPMIYGPNSKGNYPTLARIAKATPFFPWVENKRSMLYIENLAEFLAQLVLSGEGGVYVPQNSSYSNTSSLVQMIASAAGGEIRLIRSLAPAVTIAQKMPGKIGGLAVKAFGSSYYDQELSKYSGLEYQNISLEESIRRTEG